MLIVGIKAKRVRSRWNYVRTRERERERERDKYYENNGPPGLVLSGSFFFLFIIFGKD
jgi:hypothetical protein